MGSNASTLNSPGLRGTEIIALPLQGDRPFKIKLSSSNVLAEGTSAALLKGKMHAMHGHRGSIYVALKVFRLPLNSQQKELYHRLYRKELEAATRLGTSERYILPYLGTSVLGYQPVIVSTYMQHGNLLDYFSHNGVDRQPLILQVAEALKFLHTEAGMVHGDLKCENVLVSDDGTPLLADFGLSTLVAKASEEVTTDASLRVWNTVRFAAPELLSDTAQSPSGRIRSKTTQSDVWAFGMLVVQAFTSKHPWPGYDNRLVALKTLSGVRHPRPCDDATLRGLTDAWWDVCLKCWETMPETRPSIAKALEELRYIDSFSRSFGVNLAIQMHRLVERFPDTLRDYDVAPPVVMTLYAEVEKNGMYFMSTYRVKCPSRKVAKLRALLDYDHKRVDFDDLEWAADVDVVAEVLMTWLRELPEPLIVIPDLADSSETETHFIRDIDVPEAVNRLPDANYVVLRFLCGHLCRMAEKQAISDLSFRTLGDLFAPIVFHVPECHSGVLSTDNSSSGNTCRHNVFNLHWLLEHYDEVFTETTYPLKQLAI